jgi:hypothetical protein
MRAATERLGAQVTFNATRLAAALSRLPTWPPLLPTAKDIRLYFRVPCLAHSLVVFARIFDGGWRYGFRPSSSHIYRGLSATG